MPMSSHVRWLRSRVGTARLLLPSVSAVINDVDGRLLLVRQAEHGTWTTPGGGMDMDETPADAVVREAWEETGLLVRPYRVRGVYGGEDFVVRYANADETQYCMVVFDCAIMSGDPRPDGQETSEVRYFSEDEAQQVSLAPWLSKMLSRLYGEKRGTDFIQATWQPPAG